MTNDVLSHIQERGEQNRANIALSSKLQQQLQSQRAAVRQRLLAQNAAVQAATQNQRVQAKMAIIQANAQADAQRAQERLQLLQARSQVRASQRSAVQSQRGVVSGLRFGSKVLSRPSWIDRLNERVGNIPTPGGLFALFIVLLVFIFLIVPVSTTGQTRFELFWLTLLGRTKLDTSGGTLPNNGGESKTPSTPTGEKKTTTVDNTGGGVAQDVGMLATQQTQFMSDLPVIPFGLPGAPSQNGAWHG